MKDINQLRNLDKVFPSTSEVEYLVAVAVTLLESCLSHLPTLKELAGICQILDDRPIISLNPPLAPSAKKTQILSEAYLDSLPESSLCIS